MAVRVFQRAVSRQKPPRQWQLDRSHPLARGLVGCWLFNEGGGGRVMDLTATPVPGTLTNAPRWEVLGGGSAGGLALSMTAASDQYVLVGNPTKLQITDALTVATHYRLRTAPSSAYMLATKDNVAGRAWTIDVSGAGQGARLYISGGNGDLVTNSAVENIVPNAGDDRAIVGVYDPSGPQVRLYANGVLTGSSTSAAASIPTSTAGVQLGRRESDGLALDGWLRYVYIWHRVLSVAEIARLYRTPFTMFLPPTAIVAPVLVPAQLAAPASDISTGTWTATPLFPKIDETIPDDADFIQSAVNPVSDTAEIKFAPLTDPLTSTGYKLKWRSWKPS